MEPSQIRGAGPVYWAITTNPARRWVELGFVREIDPPYRWGKGLRVKLGSERTLDFGLCRRRKYEHPYEAIQAAVDGRDVDTRPPEIGDW